MRLRVNGWVFRRITQGPDHNAYFQEVRFLRNIYLFIYNGALTNLFLFFLRHLFLRGLPHLCKRRRRLTASSSSRSDLVSSIEPDFYSMSKISPLPPIGSGMTNEAGDSSNNPSNSKGKLFPEELAIEKRKSATTDAEATATDGEDATETNNKINAGTTNGYNYNPMKKQSEFK